MKASRGELYTIAAVGYVRIQDDRIEKDPDLRIQKAIKLVFQKFREFGNARQVLLWFQQEGAELPTVIGGSAGRRIIWEPTTYSKLIKMFKNPVYAGAYVYGRTKTCVSIEDGRKKVSAESKFSIFILNCSSH